MVTKIKGGYQPIGKRLDDNNPPKGASEVINTSSSIDELLNQLPTIITWNNNDFFLVIYPLHNKDREWCIVYEDDFGNVFIGERNKSFEQAIRKVLKTLNGYKGIQRIM